VVRAHISVSNPNSFPIEVDAIDWEISIDGSPPTRERSIVRQRVPGHSERSVEFGMRVSPGAAVAMGSRLAVGARKYRMAGAVQVTSEVRAMTLGFEYTGELE
jgi:LEA14-like dessication related protein